MVVSSATAIGRAFPAKPRRTLARGGLVRHLVLDGGSHLLWDGLQRRRALNDGAGQPLEFFVGDLLRLAERAGHGVHREFGDRAGSHRIAHWVTRNNVRHGCFDAGSTWNRRERSDRWHRSGVGLIGHTGRTAATRSATSVTRGAAAGAAEEIATTAASASASGVHSHTAAARITAARATTGAPAMIAATIAIAPVVNFSLPPTGMAVAGDDVGTGIGIARIDAQVVSIGAAAAGCRHDDKHRGGERQHESHNQSFDGERRQAGEVGQVGAEAPAGFMERTLRRE